MLNTNKTSRERQYYKNPKYKEKAREWRLKFYYNLTPEQYSELLDLQGGICAICKKTNKDLVVDHDHSSGKIRGILCQNCNRALGLLKDNNTTIYDAAKYLFRNREDRSWDAYFSELCGLVSLRSKDPSTQVGAIIVKNNQCISTGYNGLPRGIDDDKIERYKRPLKYSWMVHGEENALLNAARQGISCDGSILYVTPIFPCARCASAIIQSGVIKVVVDEKEINPRYIEDKRIAEEMFQLAGVEVVIRRDLYDAKQR